MKSPILLLISLALVIVSCKQTTDLKFSNIKSKTAQHLGNGVWIDVPFYYKEAKSYNGFQVPNYESSISLAVDNGSTLNDVKNFFNANQLSLKKQKMIEMTTFPFGASDTAIYTVIKDKRKRTIKYQLAIQKNNKVYRIKAFCPEHLIKKYEESINRAFQSAAFGEEEKEEVFVLAKLISLYESVSTRDGLYPTEYEDKATINFKIIEADTISGFDGAKTEFLHKEMAKYSTHSIQNDGVEKIGNGDYRTSKIIEGDNKVFGALISDEKGETTLVIGQSNSISTIKEFKLIIRRMFIKTDITWG